MGTISLQLPQSGQPNSSEDPKIPSDFTTLQTLLNGNVDTNNLSAAAGIVNGQLAVGARRLAARVLNASATANASDLIVANAGSITVTLPGSPAVNTLVGVINVSTITGAAPTTIAGGGASIYGGGFATLGTSFLLGTGGASVTLQFDGTNWAIISGQQDTGWVALTLSGGVTAAGGPYDTPSAKLVGNRVFFKGAVSNPNVGGVDPWTTLASAFRPPTSLYLVAATSNTTSIQAQLVRPTGAVGAISGTTPLYLDGLNYAVS